MSTRRKGFTLIELLVVIAIIGILAAMLFPVFARAREAARKTQCLANVKNIAMAFNIYFTDYDAFPPDETRSEVLQYFATNPGGRSGVYCTDGTELSYRVTGMNPYLRWTVILDEYIKSREVWRCPSAKWETGPNGIYGDPDWFRQLQAAGTQIGRGALAFVCDKNMYPNGWGGSLTDSFVENSKWNSSFGGFIQNIGTGESLWDGVRIAQIQDATRVVVAADVGYTGFSFLSPWTVVFPDVCYAICGSEEDGCCNGSGANQVPASEKHKIWEGGPEGAKYTRHMGGSNLGFADGHAKWYPVGAIKASVPMGKNGARFQEGSGDLVFQPSPGAGCWCGCICEYSG
jgi:prepilin-type N-terminal cleavage/methylation domain-containing protein/prepilin-type processing-associated H-X9-DG protein